MKKPKTTENARGTVSAADHAVIHRIPPELCALIAHYAPRPTLSRLAQTSRRLYTIFSPLLYRNTVTPPLTSAQSLLLIQTLNADICARRVHPALLVQNLGVASVSKSLLSQDACKIALANTIPASSVSKLRSIHWSVSSGVDALSTHIGAFPHLKELVVACNGADLNAFTFLNKLDLDILKLTLELSVGAPAFGLEDANRVLWKLAQALQSLPLTSPCLSDFSLHLKTPCFLGDDAPYEATTHLLCALNGLRFPCLRKFNFSFGFNCATRDFHDMIPSVAVFLDAHPRLTHLAINVPNDLFSDVPSFLSPLRSFTGNMDVVCALLEYGPRLEELFILDVHRVFLDVVRFRIKALPVLLTLAKLSVATIDSDGTVLKTTNEVSVVSLKSFASSFPNLTCLDVPICESITNYQSTLRRFPKLRQLHLRQYMIEDIPLQSPLATRFPASTYTNYIRRLVPHLPHLADVSVRILLDDGREQDLHLSCGCRSDVCVARLLGPPEMEIEYEFAVLRERRESHHAVEVVVESKFTDARTERRTRTVPDHAW
ncbi:hypothetical protein MKEN_01422500 [Mycena kentingensis (nom. inval.)]|nr:hypothetical protein MKEN_01422500 [Mycena kentingensis (nom. inval.)]